MKILHPPDGKEKRRGGPEKGPLLYEGKGKKVYSVKGEPDRIILFFKDSLTAYEGMKKGSFKGKGAVCREVSSLVFRYLKKEGISNHRIEDRGLRESLCFKTRIIPLEVVIRNRLAGSTAKRLGFAEGKKLPSPLLEYYYKRDDLHDPFVSEDQIRRLSLIEKKDFLPKIRQQAFLINEKLLFFFQEAGMELIDFKMEFGEGPEGLTLADDITPDSCRIRDLKTGFRMDKDRFRRGWGKVEEGYQTIRDKLTQKWEEELKEIP